MTSYYDHRPKKLLNPPILKPKIKLKKKKHIIQNLECECGSPKLHKEEACSRCIFLDGTKSSAELVGMLRVSGGALHGEALITCAGPSDIRRIYRQIDRLLKTGRLLKRQDQGTSDEITSQKYIYYLTA